jgi:hypothetical protein
MTVNEFANNLYEEMEKSLTDNNVKDSRYCRRTGWFAE